MRVLAGCTCAAKMRCSDAPFSPLDDEGTLSRLIYDALNADGDRDEPWST